MDGCSFSSVYGVLTTKKDGKVVRSLAHSVHFMHSLSTDTPYKSIARSLEIFSFDDCGWCEIQLIHMLAVVALG